MAPSLEAESLAVYEAERAKHEPAWIAGDITLEQYRAKVDPLWAEHLSRVASPQDPASPPSGKRPAKKTTPEAEADPTPTATKHNQAGESQAKDNDSSR